MGARMRQLEELEGWCRQAPLSNVDSESTFVYVCRRLLLVRAAGNRPKFWVLSRSSEVVPGQLPVPTPLLPFMWVFGLESRVLSAIPV